MAVTRSLAACLAVVSLIGAPGCGWLTDDGYECYSGRTVVSDASDVVLRDGESASWQSRLIFEPDGGWSYKAYVSGTVLAAGDAGMSTATVTVRFAGGADLVSLSVPVERNAPRIDILEEVRITTEIRDACESEPSCSRQLQVEIVAGGGGVVSVADLYVSIDTHGDTDEESSGCGIDSGGSGDSGPDPLWETGGSWGDTDTESGGETGTSGGSGTGDDSSTGDATSTDGGSSTGGSDGSGGSTGS